MFIATVWSWHGLTPNYEHRPRGYLLLRLSYTTGYYSTPTTCLFLLPTPSSFIRHLFLSLHPADTLLCTSQPDQLRCSLTSSLVSAFSVSRRLVSHELPGSVDAVSIAAGNVRVVLWKRARYTPPGKFDWHRSKVFCCFASSTSLLRR